MAEPIEMLFGVWIWVNVRNHVLDGRPDSSCAGTILEEKGWPTVKYRGSLPWAVQNWLRWSTCHLGRGLGLAKVNMY